MLDIVLFALSSPPADLPISPSINLVRANSKCVRRHRSMSVSPMAIQPKMISKAMSNKAMSNIDGTTVLDEDVELSDEELDLIAGPSRVATSMCSDVFVGRRKIIFFSSVQRYRGNHQGLINHINRRFRKFRIPIAYQAARELSQHLRAVAPRVIKGQRSGFKIKLTGRNAGQVCYNDTRCPF
ncbi:MAG: hypothetical protein QNJ47_12360 [Nostocaceae cyanobacterium]|nr:hypothetical protein [Nostocaceae cyanobacterium]